MGEVAPEVAPADEGQNAMMDPDQPAPMDPHQHVVMDLHQSSTETSPPLPVLTTASPTTAVMAAGPRPALMAAPPLEAGQEAGVPRSRESAVMDQLQPSMGTSPQPPAPMEANQSAPRMIVKRLNCENLFQLIPIILSTFFYELIKQYDLE